MTLRPPDRVRLSRSVLAVYPGRAGAYRFGAGTHWRVARSNKDGTLSLESVKWYNGEKARIENVPPAWVAIVRVVPKLRRPAP